MKKNQTREYLTRHGFDGLCNADAACGCGTDDLYPCGELGPNCRPAYRSRCSECQDDFYFTCRKRQIPFVCDACQDEG